MTFFDEAFNDVLESKMYDRNGIRDWAIKKIKELMKEKEQYELGLSVDLTELCKKIGIKESQRKDSLLIPLQEIKAIINFLMKEFEIKEEDLK